MPAPNFGLVHYGLDSFNKRSLSGVVRTAQDIYSLGESGSGLVNSAKFVTGAAIGGSLFAAPTVLGVASALFGAKQIYDGVKGFF